MTPTSKHVLWDGAVEVLCCGRRAGEALQLRGASMEEAERNNPGIAGRIAALCDRLGCALYAPHPNRFNGEIVTAREMIGRLRGHPEGEWIESLLIRGPHADGVSLEEPGEAFAVWSADSPTAVLRDPATGATVAAHCGLKSLYEWVPGDFKAGRPPVTWNMFQAVKGGAERDGGTFDPDALQGFFACGIGPKAYGFRSDLEGYAAAGMDTVRRWLRANCPNAVIESDDAAPGEDWRVWLQAVFLGQLRDLCGAPSCAVISDGVCTYEHMTKKDGYTWHSSRRDGARAGRNLVIVIRRR